MNEKNILKFCFW